MRVRCVLVLVLVTEPKILVGKKFLREAVHENRCTKIDYKHWWY